MGSFCKPIQHQNSTKSKYRKSSTVVTGECSNNVKETGMAGIWSGAFTRRQMWGGGRESRSEEWELHGCALRSAFLPRCSWHTHMHTYMRAPTHSWIIHIVNRNKCHAHTHKKKRYTAAESFCWRSWSLPLTAGSKSRGQREKEGARGRGRLSEERGVPRQDCAVNWDSDQRLLSKHRVKAQRLV